MEFIGEIGFKLHIYLWFQKVRTWTKPLYFSFNLLSLLNTLIYEWEWFLGCNIFYRGLDLSKVHSLNCNEIWYAALINDSCCVCVCHLCCLSTSCLIGPWAHNLIPIIKRTIHSSFPVLKCLKELYKRENNSKLSIISICL